MKKTLAKILVVEDDKNAGILLEENLKLTGYDVTLARDGQEGMDMYNKISFDLCLLDIMMPKKDGHQLAREIRKKNADIPIIFLTARTMDFDKIEGFRNGCDDYITKPFNVEELLWRIKAILRRSRSISAEEERTSFRIGKYQFNYSERMLSIGKITCNLSTKEADLLRILSLHKNKILSRNTIMNEVWERDDYFVSKSLDVYLSKIRKYLSNDPGVEILNIHGYGYKLIVR